MSYEIRQKAVHDVIRRTNEALATGSFNHGEVIIGLGELVGKIIVEAAHGPIQCKELVKVVTDHLERTVKIGAEVREKRVLTAG